MKTIHNNGSISIQREFKILKQIKNSNLVRLEDDIFKLNENSLIYCIIIEYCEVKLALILFSKYV